jgi:hypothetical protein
VARRGVTCDCFRGLLFVNFSLKNDILTDNQSEEISDLKLDGPLLSHRWHIVYHQDGNLEIKMTFEKFNYCTGICFANFKEHQKKQEICLRS